MADENPPALVRIEKQLERLTEAVTRLVIIEERQRTTDTRLDKIDALLQKQDDRIQTNEKTISRFFNIGMGAWATAMMLWALLNSRIGQQLFGA